MRGLLFLLPAVVLLATLAVGIPRDASAHGVLDQEFDVAAGNFDQIKFFEPIGQEFKPVVSNLVAVEVRLFGCNSSFGDDTITLRVREATIGGTIKASTSELVDKSFSGLFHFDISATLIPGDTYVIELDATEPTHCWQDNHSGTYADGRQILSGSPRADRDFRFKTFVADAPIGGTLQISTGPSASVSESEAPAGGDQAKFAALAAVGGGLGLAFLAAGGWVIRRRLLH